MSALDDLLMCDLQDGNMDEMDIANLLIKKQEEAAKELVQLNASNAELTEACEIWFDKYEVLEAENARLQKEMEEAKQVIILLKFDCEELSKQEFPNVLTSIEMAIAFLAKYDGTFRQPEGGVK